MGPYRTTDIMKKTFSLGTEEVKEAIYYYLTNEEIGDYPKSLEEVDLQLTVSKLNGKQKVLAKMSWDEPR